MKCNSAANKKDEEKWSNIQILVLASAEPRFSRYKDFDACRHIFQNLEPLY